MITEVFMLPIVLISTIYAPEQAHFALLRFGPPHALSRSTMSYSHPSNGRATDPSAGRLCCVPQPGSNKHDCIMYLGPGGPHQSFVSLWNDGDVAAKRRAPAYIQGRPSFPNAARTHQREEYSSRRS